MELTELLEISKAFRIVVRYLVNIFLGLFTSASLYYLITITNSSRYWERVLDMAIYVSQNIFFFSIYIITSFFIGFSIVGVIKIISLPKIGRLFPTAIKINAAKYETYYDSSENKDRFFLRWIDSWQFYLRISQAIGSAFLVNFLILLVCFLIQHKLSDLILTIIYFIFAICFVISHKGNHKYLQGIFECFEKIH